MFLYSLYLLHLSLFMFPCCLYLLHLYLFVFLCDCKFPLRKGVGNLKILCHPPGSCPGGAEIWGGAKWYQGGGVAPLAPPPESGPVSDTCQSIKRGGGDRKENCEVKVNQREAFF